MVVLKVAPLAPGCSRNCKPKGGLNQSWKIAKIVRGRWAAGEVAGA